MHENSLVLVAVCCDYINLFGSTRENKVPSIRAVAGNAITSDAISCNYKENTTGQYEYITVSTNCVGTNKTVCGLSS